MNEFEQQKEIRRLEKVLLHIQRKLKQGTEHCRVSNEELQDSLTAYWENPRTGFWDQAQLTEAVERQRSLAYTSNKRQSQYLKMALSPYFGRIDFVEAGLASVVVPEIIYIGIASLTDSDSGENLIYDWRSPVAAMFYDYERGNSQYQCPAGIIYGEIILKRQYRIRDGRMVYMFDADLKIDDEMLQKLLSQSVDQKMRTIVNTIQREQNRVIRDQKHRILLVQGTAGSGKTSIALHRVAYLLYRERNLITARNILIFSPNSIFSDYISNVLPELGEDNVLQTTFKEYMHNNKLTIQVAMEDAASQLEYLLGGPDEEYSTRVAGVQYKSSPGFAEVIKKYLNLLTEKLIREYPAIKFRGRVIFAEKEWEELFYKNLTYLPVIERLKQIKRRIQIKLRPLVHELRKEKEQEIAATGEEVNEKTIKALARLAVWQELSSLRSEIDQMTTMDPFLLYRRLFEDNALFGSLEETGVPKDWSGICRQSLAWFNSGRLSFEDSIPFLYFQGCLAGFPTTSGIRHLIVDEAQDYTELQFAIFQRLFPKCSWTILGDPDQSVNPYQHGVDFAKIGNMLSDRQADSENFQIIRLIQSYRSTQEIQAFSRALLAKTEEVEHIRRSGPLPQLVKLQSPEQIPDLIAKAIQELKKEGLQSIAVITKTSREGAAIYGALKDKTAMTISITLITGEMDAFQRGTVVIPAYLAKGLEFDAVLICDVGAQTYSREEERGILYIACTRALHRLQLFYSGELSPLVAEIHANLYAAINC